MNNPDEFDSYINLLINCISIPVYATTTEKIEEHCLSALEKSLKMIGGGHAVSNVKNYGEVYEFLRANKELIDKTLKGKNFELRGLESSQKNKWNFPGRAYNFVRTKRVKNDVKLLNSLQDIASVVIECTGEQQSF